jgi:hypothetical protein
MAEREFARLGSVKRDGWRLVQIFAQATAVTGATSYDEPALRVKERRGDRVSCLLGAAAEHPTGRQRVLTMSQLSGRAAAPTVTTTWIAR